MSSLSHHAGLDAPVAIKILYDGATRRAKMPLREMVPRTLEKHLRTFLQIPDDSRIIIERFSDSAAAYVLLDSANVSVYKQLYRAAKAKSKLKLRVTVLGKEDKTGSMSAAVKDESQIPKTLAAPAFQFDVVKPKSPTPTATPQIESPAMKLALRGLGPRAAQVAGPPKDMPDGLHSPGEWSKEFQRRVKDIKQTTDDIADLGRQLKWNFPAASADKLPSKPRVAPSKPPSAATGNEKAISKPASPCDANGNDIGTSITPVPAWLPKGNGISPVSKPASSCPSTGCSFAVCCNHCERTIPNAHYHCSTCDDGDFDLCQSCVDQGVTCYSNDHWLIKRTMKNGQLVNSTTETIAPKPKPKAQAKEETKGTVTITGECAPDVSDNLPPSGTAADSTSTRWACLSNMRTCNCCVQELPEREFLHCKSCEDYDLCQSCFANDAHGHHPKHGFVPAVSAAHMPDHIKAKMRPGRNQMHHAICDGCDKYITGVRHKCLDCPDWDYCSECVLNAHLVHVNHRFVPIYEPISNTQAWPAAQPMHVGICCDGPLCSASQAYPSYIRGSRYKCAVCLDLDFCANCEVHPGNNHNKTHPLIKFKTPVRHVSVTTTGERQDGKRMPVMGDRMDSKSLDAASSSGKNTFNAVQTVVEMKPQDSISTAIVEPAVKDIEANIEPSKDEPAPAAPRMSSTEKSSAEEALRAVFVRDSVQDGTILPPNQVFEQTWVLRNQGGVAWPAGCSVKFVGGDYMGHVDSAHPACILELESASESTVCYAPLAPGQEFSFTVLLRTPARPGRIISYWRLTTQDGLKFGHRLWCEVNVRPAADATRPKLDVIHVEDFKKEQDNDSKSSSTMIFPKLDKESPSASIHEEVQPDAQGPAPTSTVEAADGFEDCGDDNDDEWDASETGFLTDEEYDILDASDEEFLEQQQQKSLKK